MQVRHRESGVLLLDAPGHTLAGTDLARTVLLYGDLREIDFRGADLTGADLCETDMSGARLDEAMLTGADLSGARLVGTSFRGASLADAKMLGVDLGGADLTEADLSHTAFRLARASTPASFRDAKLMRSNLSHASFAACDFTGADLTAATCHGTDLDRAILRGASLTSAHLLDVSLREADLEWADLTLATLHRVRFAGARCANTLFGSTVLAHDLDLAEALGLDDCRHASPSSVDLGTLRAAQGRLPAPFLAGVGLGDLAPALRSLLHLGPRPD
jgi:uncharacterized protein YjbI with pentapeptide repeats